MSIYILLLIIIICWTINPFLKKAIAQKMKPEEYLIVNHFAISFIMISYLIYLLTKKKFDTNCLRKLEYKDLGTILLVSLSTIMGSLILIYLLQKYDASFIIPNLQPVVIVLTILIGYFIYKETLDKKKIIGILFIISGIVLINISKRDNDLKISMNGLTKAKH